MTRNVEHLYNLLDDVADNNLAVDKANKAVKIAKQRAVGARAARLDVFDSAGQSLRKIWESGVLTPEELMRVKFELDTLDPVQQEKRRMFNQMSIFGSDQDREDLHPNDVEAMMARFVGLREGEPVMGLVAEGNRKPHGTGIIVGTPSNIRVEKKQIYRDHITVNTSLVPYVWFNIDLQTTTQPTTRLEMSAYTLREGLIGREAIARAAQTACFEVEQHGRAIRTTSAHLADLRRGIDELYSLGMEPVDTATLDAAIVESEENNKRHRTIYPSSKWRASYPTHR
ncbi:MAG: hypothetical protein WAQ25_03035 [Candidatus Saccharimonas sp.]